MQLSGTVTLQERHMDPFTVAMVRSCVFIRKQTPWIWQFRIRIHLEISAESHLVLRMKCEVHLMCMGVVLATGINSQT